MINRPSRLLLKQALIAYANKHNRPHFTPCFVNDFIAMIDLNRPHPITNEVIKIALNIEENQSNHGLNETQKMQKELRLFCSKYGRIKALSDVSGVSVDFIKDSFDQDPKEFKVCFERLKPFFNEAINHLEHKTHLFKLERMEKIKQKKQSNLELFTEV